MIYSMLHYQCLYFSEWDAVMVHFIWCHSKEVPDPGYHFALTKSPQMGPRGTTVHACAMTLTWGDIPNRGCGPRHESWGIYCSSVPGAGWPHCQNLVKPAQRGWGVFFTVEDTGVGRCRWHFSAKFMKLLQASSSPWLLNPSLHLHGCNTASLGPTL